MIYAVISDIHGNLDAFEAVVDDAFSKGAESFLLLGDYLRDTPYVNEIVDKMRELPNCIAIAGNGEKGILSFYNTNSTHCEYEQLLPNFWSYSNLTKSNLEYLASLPDTADIALQCDKTMHLSHSIPLIHHNPRLGVFHSGDYARKMEEAPFTFLQGIQAMQAVAEQYADVVSNFNGDICLFGHKHLQFKGLISDKVLLNPGSCGFPADYDIRAPYALIYDKKDDVDISLMRVPYDVDSVIKSIIEFDEYPHAKLWGSLRAVMLRDASDLIFSEFWKYVRIRCKGVFPVENELWRNIVNSYMDNNISTN